MSTMLPLPSARIRPTPDSWANGLAELVAVAVHRVGRAVDEAGHRRCPTRRVGPKSVARRINWS